MKKHIIKKIISTIIVLTTISVNACWYKYWQYNDYIAGINNYENHTVTENINSLIQYTIKNNQQVDLPMSVLIKLQENPIQESLNNTEFAASLASVTCILQYRVLPNEDWITVAKQTFKPGTIPENSTPAFYLGKNNINPIGCKAGDIIMIRLYVSRGETESGDLDSLCNEKLINNKLLDNYQYSFDDKNHTSTMYDLGGSWLPHCVTTVIFSGKYRPVR